MDKFQAFTLGRGTLLFIGQIIVLLICLGYIEFVYYDQILPDKRVKEVFQQTTCNLLQKQLSEKGRFPHRYRSDFLLTYSANGMNLQSWVTGNGLDQAYTTDRTSQEALLNQYNVGEAYTCWFDPNHPEIAVLVLRHSWTSTFALFIPSVIALITFYYLARTVFIVLGTAKVKAREIKNKRKKP